MKEWLTPPHLKLSRTSVRSCLLFMKTLAIEEIKYLEDVKLIAKNIVRIQNRLYETITTKNRQLLSGIDGLVYLEKDGTNA